jgi:hypothetical protein
MTDIYMPFYFEWADVIDGLGDEDYGRLVRAILAFARGKKKKPTNLSPVAQVAYSLITSTISRSQEKRRQKEVSVQPSETKTFRKIESRRTTNKPNMAENERDNSTKCENSSDNMEQIPTNETFTPPTRAEVQNFFKKQGLKSNPDEFFNFYESNGWKVGQNTMVNWYASAENFEIKYQKAEEVAKMGGFYPKRAQNSEKSASLNSIDADEAWRIALERSANWDDYDDDDDDEPSCGAVSSG